MFVLTEDGMKDMTAWGASWKAGTVVALVWAMLIGGRAVAGQDKPLTASNAWVKLPAPGETQAMAFANVENPTMYAVYLKSANADVAGKVELRDASLSGDAARKPLEFVTVPAFDWAYMGPKGIHLLLLDLKRPLKEGDMVALSLTTDISTTIQVSAVVKKE
jgi:periplasmic copper chaperone A